jgi:hypothetical protein
MLPSGQLLAWIEPSESGEYLGAFVGDKAPRRQPATQSCSSVEEARLWVIEEAAALDLPVKWLGPAQRQ